MGDALLEEFNRKRKETLEANNTIFVNVLSKNNWAIEEVYNNHEAVTKLLAAISDIYPGLDLSQQIVSESQVEAIIKKSIGRKSLDLVVKPD